MPSGLLVVVRNAETTLSRLSARVLRWPLPVWMISRSDSDSATRSKVCSRFWIASAPIAPSKYFPNRIFISR